MRLNTKKKLIITADELNEAKKLYKRIEALKEQLSEVKKKYTIAENDFFIKYDANAEIEAGAPMFTIKEGSRRNISWKNEFEHVLGVEAIERVINSVVPTQYRDLEF